LFRQPELLRKGRSHWDGEDIRMIMSGIIQDIRYAARRLAKSPLFVLTALVSLALGVGINTAVFSVTHSLLNRRISAANPQDLVDVSLSTPAGSMRLTSAETLAFTRAAQSFSGVIAYTHRLCRLSGEGRPEMVSAFIATPNFFPVFGQSLLLGRGFLPGKESAGEVILSHKFWQRRFGGEPGVLGRSVVLYSGATRSAFTVVGVAPPDFQPVPMRAPDVVLAQPDMAGSDLRQLNLWCRLKPGVSMAQARSESELVAGQLASVFPESFGKAKLAFAPAVRQGPSLAAAQAILQAVVGLVLLIACANVMNLLLARHEARRAEMATRLALGASRARVIRQLLIESLLLAIPSSLAGLGFAAVVLRLLETIKIPGLDATFYFYLDHSVFAFALIAGIAGTVIAGLWPARAASKPDLVPALKGAGGAIARRKFGLRGALVTAQLALAVFALTAAAMLTKGLWNLNPYDAGLDPYHVYTATLSPSMNGYPQGRAAELRRQMTSRIERLPGVRAITYARSVPGADSGTQLDIVNPGSAARSKDSIRIRANSVTPGFFGVFGIQMLHGREFRDADLSGPRVCVINESLARRFWPGQNPIGRTLRSTGSNGTEYEVIGIARNTEYEKAGEEYASFVYLPLASDEFLSLLVRTSGRAESAAEPMRRVIEALDAELPLLNTGILADRLTGGGAGLELRLRAGLVCTLGLLALILSSLGLYGVVAYLVSRRTRELGIRLALGATRLDIAAAVVKDGGKLVAIGAGAGVALSLVVCPLLTAHLYGVKANEPVVILAACLFLAFVAAAAMLIPARRACRVEAISALRYE